MAYTCAVGGASPLLRADREDLMNLTVAADPVPLRVDSSGAVRVGRTRVLLDLVVFGYKQGESAEQIAEHYPALQLADVNAVIAYYLRHQDEVEAYLRAREQRAGELRQMWEARYDRSELRACLLARRAQQGER
jgi:uncharacterized protein (DUF433 family)